MKKKATGKQKARPASRPDRAKAAKAKTGESGKTSRGKAAPPAKAKAKSKAGSKAKPKPKPKAKSRSAASLPSSAVRKTAKAAPKAKAKAKGKGSAQGGSAPKGGAGKSAAPGDLLRKVAPRLREETVPDTEVILAPELISRTLPEAVPAEDEGTLRKVMSSLTALFGGRDDLSDAELDALLDSKMASGEIPPSAALDPLDEAQSIVYEAWNSEGPQRVRLARKALETSPDCADAYVILAEDSAGSEEEALELFRKGVEAGERAIGPEVFRKSEGKFWDVMETRPYMRARLGLAECLWEAGRKEEALLHLRELLRLNPADNQGVRKILDRYLEEAGEEPA